MAPSNGGPRSDGIPNNSKPKHVIIIGAGLTGLILAQALRNINHKHPESPRFTFGLYERDSHAFARGGGWSLTIHWALTDLRNVLPMEIIERFDECLVNPEAAEKKDPGNFQFLDLKTVEKQHVWPIPLGAASRVAREKLMALLMEGLDIQVRILKLCCAVVFVLLMLASSGPNAWRKSVTQLTPPSALTSTMAQVQQATF